MDAHWKLNDFEAKAPSTLRISFAKHVLSRSGICSAAARSAWVEQLVLK